MEPFQKLLKVDYSLVHHDQRLGEKYSLELRQLHKSGTGSLMLNREALGALIPGESLPAELTHNYLDKKFSDRVLVCTFNPTPMADRTIEELANSELILHCLSLEMSVRRNYPGQPIPGTIQNHTKISDGTSEKASVYLNSPPTSFPWFYFNLGLTTAEFYEMKELPPETFFALSYALQPAK